MTSIIFGEPRFTKPEMDSPDPNIIDVEWLDENKKPIGVKTINGKEFSNVAYGQKVRVKIRFLKVPDGHIVFLKINSSVDRWGFRPKLPLMRAIDNEVVSEPFVVPVSLYRDDTEQYDYSNHYTTNAEPLELYITVSFSTTFKSQKRHILKPYTYFRNYEELTGLFQENGNGKKTNDYKPDVNNPKNTIQNYEDKFIHYNAGIASIVAAFIQFINDLPVDPATNRAAITDQVEQQARALWNAATSQVQGGKLDDRPLYWARNKMQVYLKRHPFFKADIDLEKSQVKRGTTLDTIIRIFEEKSRNYTGVDFSKVPVGMKKVLITGFDPFLLDSFKYPKAFNILQSNPSGVVALALADSDQLGAYIQTMVVPVRYTDFDGSQEPDEGQGEGIIEKYIKPFINQVDMIVTISQYLPNENVIDKFSTATRGGFIDNLNFRRVTGSHALITLREWIETTLPKEFTNAPKVTYNWKFNNTPNPKHLTPIIGQKLLSGSGGDYLSNEIFYRVAKLRVENNDKKGSKGKLSTGHFHIEKLQDETKGEDLNPVRIADLLKIVKKSIEEGIKGL